MGVTSQCNMRCPFCYSQDKRRSDDLESNIWISFLKENAAWISAINYGTGENTLSQAWYELIPYVRENFPQIRQALTTNGTLAEAIRDKDREAAIDRCVDEIDISIDFADPEQHDKIRGFSGAFDMAVRTLAYCKDHGKRATIVILGLDNTLSVSNLKQLFELAGRHDAFVRINLYRHVSERSMLNAPGLSTVLNALDWILKNHSVVSVSEPVFGSIYGIPTKEVPDTAFSARILPDGSITPSTYLITEEWVAGNIRDSISMKDLIRTAPFQRFLKPVIPRACSSCYYEYSCRGGNRDRRFLSWDSLDRPDPYCPHVFDDIRRREQILSPKILTGKETVHSGYLPTLIFSPGTGACPS
jgi:radical SAM protein with 4Fe4S-binding SPASM domain